MTAISMIPNLFISSFHNGIRDRISRPRYHRRVCHTTRARLPFSNIVRTVAHPRSFSNPPTSVSSKTVTGPYFGYEAAVSATRVAHCSGGLFRTCRFTIRPGCTCCTTFNRSKSVRTSYPQAFAMPSLIFQSSARTESFIVSPSHQLHWCADFRANVALPGAKSGCNRFLPKSLIISVGVRYWKLGVQNAKRATNNRLQSKFSSQR